MLDRLFPITFQSHLAAPTMLAARFIAPALRKVRSQHIVSKPLKRLNFVESKKPESSSHRLYSSAGQSSGSTSSPWGRTDRPSTSSPTLDVDLSGSWNRYLKPLGELFGLIICFSFALATSLRANQHKAVHEEEVEALNYEIIEAEEQMERVKQNWKRLLKQVASSGTAQRSGDVMVSLKLLETMANDQLFNFEQLDQEKQSASEEVQSPKPTAAAVVSRAPSTSSSVAPRIILY